MELSSVPCGNTRSCDDVAAEAHHSMDIVTRGSTPPRSRSTVLNTKLIPAIRNNLINQFDLICSISLPNIRRSRSTPPGSGRNCEAASPTLRASQDSSSSSIRMHRTNRNAVARSMKSSRINAWNVVYDQPKPDPYRYFRRFHRSPEYSRELIQLINFAFFVERWKSYTEAFNAAYPMYKMTNSEDSRYYFFFYSHFAAGSNQLNLSKSTVIMPFATPTPNQRRFSTSTSSSKMTREGSFSSTVGSFDLAGEYRGSATLLGRIFRFELSKPKQRRMSTPLSIYPHQYTEDPTVAWEMLKPKRPVKNVRQMKLDSPMKADHVRFVCVACTHGVALDPAFVPPGDILIVAGDFTSCGLPKEIKMFNENMGKDIGEAKETALKQALSAALSSAKVNNPKSLLTNVIYLQDSMVELFGIRIYGTPWQPKMDNWAFNLPRGQTLLTKWNQIPTGVDVLITHTPPLGHGDTLSTGSRAGCVELLNSVVKRIRPKYHVFGHVHEGYGCTSDGYTKFINCCLMNENLEMTNTPVIFDIPVNAETKAHFLQNSKKLMKKLTHK
ncbi:unnamed protein product [Anisakis simplex]|uniref:UPF0046 protein (inferred by orthology to a C. elegans protein) n=1 Tax=Anisakis simplex TaxID=6269 RepID=A0A0M3JR25_ANISI|nr:unnamed protein product [Anisakis simplex]